jgi:hypothetical protein
MSSPRTDNPLVSPVGPHGARWTDWLFSFMWLRFALYIAVIHELMPTLFQNSRNLLEYMDEHQFYAWELANKITVLRYHQLPAWNPFWCGGTLGVAAPEDIFFAPDNLLRLFFDVGIARHLSVILGMALGAEGTFRLARASGSSGLASLGAALIFGLNTAFPLWVGNGFFNFIVGFGLMPWVGWCLVMGMEKPAYRYLGGFFLAWIFLSAGTYPAPYTVMLVGFLTFALAAMSARDGASGWVKPFESATVLGVIFALLACAKFIPLMLFLRQFSRTWNPIESFGAPAIFGNFTAVHIPLLILAGLAPLTRDRWAVVFTLGAGFFFVMAMGDFDPMSPYHIVKQLPLFKQLRSPERHIVVVFLFLALGAARTITVIEDAVPRLVSLAFGARSFADLPKPLRFLAVGLGTAFVALAFGPKYAQMVKESGPSYAFVQFSYEAPRTYEQPFRQHRGNRRDGHAFPAMNMGSIYCITGIPVPESRALRGDLEQEEYPLDPQLATVRRVSWSPNVIVLDVDARRATRVIVNQNHHVHWRPSVGRLVSHQGLLAVDVPAGRHRLELRFVDRALQASITVSLVTLLALLVVALAYFARWARAMIAPFLPERPPAGGEPDAVTEPAVEAAVVEATVESAAVVEAAVESAAVESATVESATVESATLEADQRAAVERAAIAADEPAVEADEPAAPEEPEDGPARPSDS